MRFILSNIVSTSLGRGRRSWSEPPRDRANKMACALSEDSDQPGHPPSLIRVFAVRMEKADLSLRLAHSHFVGFVMRRLILMLAVFLCVRDLCFCMPHYSSCCFQGRAVITDCGSPLGCFLYVLASTNKWAMSWDYGTFRPPYIYSSNVHAQPSSGARCLIFHRTLRLLPYFMSANSEDSGETSLVAYVIITIIAWAGSSVV